MRVADTLADEFGFSQTGSGGYTSSYIRVAHARGELPFRLDHKDNTIQWDQPLSLVDYKVLIWCFEALRETVHPWAFLSREAIREMLAAPGAAMKVMPLVDKVMLHLRTALRAPNMEIFLATITALRQLIQCIGEQPIHHHLPQLITPLRKWMYNPRTGDAVLDTFRDLISAAGEKKNQVFKIIHSRVPTFDELPSRH